MKAEYIEHMGSDLAVVNAARVSFDKESEWEINFKAEKEGYLPTLHLELSEKDKKLIQYLTKHNHWTPFSHCQITMREKVPIFVARQRFKHMVGFTYNEVSRRYVDDEPEFFTPKEWRGKPVNAKQGSSDEIITQIERPHLWGLYGESAKVVPRKEDIQTAYERVVRLSEHLYKDMVKSGIAPEQARMVLPQSMYTEYFCTGSLAAWARAYKLRSDEHAQKEIQDLAVMWDQILRPLFPVSWSALCD